MWYYFLVLSFNSMFLWHKLNGLKHIISVCFTVPQAIMTVFAAHNNSFDETQNLHDKPEAFFTSNKTKNLIESDWK